MSKMTSSYSRAASMSGQTSVMKSSVRLSGTCPLSGKMTTFPWITRRWSSNRRVLLIEVETTSAIKAGTSKIPKRASSHQQGAREIEAPSQAGVRITDWEKAATRSRTWTSRIRLNWGTQTLSSTRYPSTRTVRKIWRDRANWRGQRQVSMKARGP